MRFGFGYFEKGCLLAVFLCLVGALFYPYWFPQAAVCSQNYANFGQWVSGIASIVGVPLLILTLYFQTRVVQDEDREKKFERYCKSIELGLAYIKNKSNNLEGGAAIIRYGELCETRTLNFDKVTNELTIDALKSVVAALNDLLDWVSKPSNRFTFHSFFRVRFMSLIMAFDKMLPPGVREMTESELFKTYANDNAKHMLLLAIKRLINKEYEVWIDYEEAVYGKKSS